MIEYEDEDDCCNMVCRLREEDAHKCSRTFWFILGVLSGMVVSQILNGIY